MTRHDSHVSEWASLLGERVADDASEVDGGDGRLDGPDRQPGS